MFILCSGINDTNFDETLLLAIFPKFDLTSLVVWSGDEDEDIFMSLLQTPSVHETLEHFRIKNLDIFKCTSVIELFIQFKRIKAIEIRWHSSKNDDDDELKEWILEINQFEGKLREKHSEVEIYIDYQKR